MSQSLLFFNWIFCEDMKVSLENLLELMVTTVGNVNRVSYLNSKATSNGPNIQAVIRDIKNKGTPPLNIKIRIRF